MCLQFFTIFSDKFQNHSPTFPKVLVIWDASPKPPKPPIIKSTSSTYRLIRVAHWFTKTNPVKEDNVKASAAWRWSRVETEKCWMRNWEMTTLDWQSDNNVTTFFFWRKQCDNLMWQHISEKINIKKETVYTAFVLTVWICYHQQQDGVPVFQQNHTSLPGRVNINLSGRLTASAIPKMFWLGRCSTIMPNNYNTNYNH